MSEHKLQPGKVLIDALSVLGRGLGYSVQCEQPLGTGRHPVPAVDVAWKKDETQDFPLMIFEVESSAGNTIANNALKVFSKPNQDFEKPLFFFHLILRAGKDTSRIDALCNQYGTSNYRVYCLNQNETTTLIRDVLTQHRRLSSHLDVFRICTILEESWQAADLDAVLDHAEFLEFETNFLDAYVRLSVTDDRFLKRFVEGLSKLEAANLLRRVPVKYGTFLGESWHQPIHLALLARTKRESPDQMLAQLQDWQEKSYNCTMIGPHFGMSRDYDNFLVGVSAGFWSAIAAIFGTHPAKRYIAKQMHLICEQLENAHDRFALYGAVWLLHVTASAEDHVLFEYARNLINGRGGIAVSCLTNAPFVVPSFNEVDNCEWDESLVKDKVFVPKLKQFARCSHSYLGDKVNSNAVRLATGLLLEPESAHWFAPSAIS